MESPVFNAGLELRAAGDGTRRLSGSFPYNSLAVMEAGNGGGRRPQKEQFAPRAFGFTVDDPGKEIHLLAGHDFNKPLASKQARTLILKDGDRALSFEAILVPDILRTSWGTDFVAAFAAGLVGGISPGFRVAPIEGAEEVEEEDPRKGKALIRTIRQAVLFELSTVTRPAYPETATDLRQFQPEQPVRFNAMNRWRA
jgi:HK97 family phage prohead protease